MDKLSIGRADIEKDPGISRVNIPEDPNISKVNKSDIDRANTKKIDGKFAKKQVIAQAFFFFL